MKKYFIFAASALALASCSSDDYLGNNPGNENGASNAINFAGGTGKTTRATGQDAATALGSRFVVYGYKTTGGQKSTVYDYYTIKYDGKINQAEGNTQGWGYVGGTPNMLSSLNDIENNQTIKYWDYSASQYDFIAFSLGKDLTDEKQTKTNEDGKVKVSTVNTENEPTYSITGSVADLAKCYIADRVTAKAKLAENEQNKKEHIVAYKDDVQFNFRSLATKVRLGLYETINGYSVKDVKFYTADNAKDEDGHPYLYATGKTIPTSDGKGTMTIAFGSNDAAKTDFNQAKATWAAAEETENSPNITFGNLALRDKQKNEYKGTEFLGRSMATNDVSTTDYQTTLPGTTVGALTLKVDYTLESIDGSGEEIKVTGATATIPAEYTNWKPNYAYTYIFKISDKTNGNTGTTPDDPAGLYPISFDAIVTETQEGQQNTITIVDDKSITTYAKGEQNNEYKAGSNIYVSISGQTLSDANTALYTASLAIPGSNIPESLVALCLKGNATGEDTWTLDNNGNKLTVTKANAPEIVTKIDAADVADGNAIQGNFAKFKPNAAGNYVFEYTYTVGGETKKAYKVIKVVAAD